MRKLYKYFSGLDAEYFSNPSFKLASASSLNDPFETILASELLATMEELIDKDHKSYGMFKRLLGEDAKLKDSYDTLFKMCGIVSLSETQHNLLMWSHYANQHKGLCVGYNANALSDIKFPRFYKLPLTKLPVKVNYDNKKTFDYENDFNYTNINELFKSVLNKILTTKGNDWIYEKEHRFILPMNISDRLRIYKNGKLEKEREFYENKDKRYEEKNKRLRFPISSATKPENTYLLDIAPSNITDVYLGCKMPRPKARELKDAIKSSDLTKHINVYKFIESHERFEIEVDKSF